MSKTIDAPESSSRRPQPAPRGVWDQVCRLLKPIASLRLTVVLFALCMVLVFCGTNAQVNWGIEKVVQTYFRSMGTWVAWSTLLPSSWNVPGKIALPFIWIPFQTLFPRFLFPSLVVPGSFPFPGGWLLGLLLLINLVAAHLTRFRFTWQRSGIFLMHAGVMLLLLGELVAGLFQVEGRMEILVGSSANFINITNSVELAVIRPGAGDTDEVIVIPEHMLKAGARIAHPDLPVDIVVDRYLPNSKIVNAGLSTGQPATAAQWTTAKPVQVKEVTGTDADQPIDAPSAFLTVKKKGSDESLATPMVSVWQSRHDPPLLQRFSVDGKPYDLSLRFKRVYKPYTIYLKEFKHDKYIGTETPKDFRSSVRLVDPSHDEDRELDIWMNHPLRHAGETFYQAGFRPGDMATTLQVVRNPGWLMPYFACGLTAIGMLIHFGLMLSRFLSRML